MEFLNRKSLGQALTLLKSENDNMEVNIRELPEIILIDTQFVNKSSYTTLQTKDDICTLDLSMYTRKPNEPNLLTSSRTVINTTTLPMVQLPNLNIDNSMLINQTQNLPQLLTTTPIFPPITSAKQESIKPSSSATIQIKKHNSADAASLAVVEQTDAETCTDSPNPVRERAVQTDDKSPKCVEIGIQCNIEDSSEMTPSDISITVNQTIDKSAAFLNFVTKKSHQYSNGKIECMLCGEVKASKNAMQLHMNIHWGPTVLCHRCGIQFEHKSLYNDHICMVKKLTKSKLLRKNLLKCPHASKNFMLIISTEKSKCTKRNHTFKIYKCKPCQRINSAILSPIVRKGNKLYFAVAPLSKLSASYYCPVCLKHCSNTLKLTKHKQRCLINYVERHKKKRKLMVQKIASNFEVYV